MIHALNEWMYETWPFNYEDRIFTTPVITLPIVDKAIEELEWVVERGAKVVLIRPAPVPGFRGTRSFALPEFDPFWERVVEHDILVAHARLRQRLRRATPTSGRAATARCCRSSRPAFRMLSPWRPIEDAIAVARLPRRPRRASRRSRSPSSRTAAAGSSRCCERPDRHLQEDAAGLRRGSGRRDASATSTSARSGRRTSAHLADLLGDDHVLFGSDYPHPEGLADPRSYVDDLEHHGPTSASARSWAATSPSLMNVENTPVVPAPATV